MEQFLYSKRNNPSEPSFLIRTFGFELPLKSYYLLHKIALLVNNLKISARELEYLCSHPNYFISGDPPVGAPFNLNSIPLDAIGFRPELFHQWLRIYRLFQLRDNIPGIGISLMDILEFAANEGDKTKLTKDVIKQLMIVTNQNSGSFDILRNWLAERPSPVPDAILKNILLNEWTDLK